MEDDNSNDPGKQIVDVEVADKFGEDLPVVVKDYVVIAEVMTDEGNTLLVSTSPQSTPWAIYGLLQYGERFFDDQFYNPNFNPEMNDG
ncbi:MAG: hypothetical protein CL489_09970 [Acidobacteria bacterium]|nr:hypothetical protein [Acidobacteriota bacterium]|tara:strand:+ start:109 stop:372 length:264 start_codon:yes stop_codon:yes gene_type:complete